MKCNNWFGKESVYPTSELPLACLCISEGGSRFCWHSFWTPERSIGKSHWPLVSFFLGQNKASPHILARRKFLFCTWTRMVNAKLVGPKLWVMLSVVGTCTRVPVVGFDHWTVQKLGKSWSLWPDLLNILHSRLRDSEDIFGHALSTIIRTINHISPKFLLQFHDCYQLQLFAVTHFNKSVISLHNVLPVLAQELLKENLRNKVQRNTFIH